MCQVRVNIVFLQLLREVSDISKISRVPSDIKSVYTHTHTRIHTLRRLAIYCD